MTIREKIKSRLDSLEEMMERQEHLSNPDLVKEQLQSITKFWSALEEDQREYCSTVRLALIKNLSWS